MTEHLYLSELNNDHDESLIKNRLIFKPVEEFLKSNTSCFIDLYQIVKFHGYNIQISYIECLNDWIIGTKNYSCLLNFEKLNNLQFPEY